MYCCKENIGEIARKVLRNPLLISFGAKDGLGMVFFEPYNFYSN